MQRQTAKLPNLIPCFRLYGKFSCVPVPSPILYACIHVEMSDHEEGVTMHAVTYNYEIILLNKNYSSFLWAEIVVSG